MAVTLCPSQTQYQALLTYIKTHNIADLLMEYKRSQYEYIILNNKWHLKENFNNLITFI